MSPEARKKGIRSVGLLGAVVVAATGTKLIIDAIERPAQPSEIVLSQAQERELDKTAAGTTLRLLHDKFALDKRISVDDSTTTVTVEQNMRSRSNRVATLAFTFAGRAQGTDAADTERFLKTGPRVERVDIQKYGAYSLRVTEGTNNAASVQLQMPEEALHPHNDAIALDELSGYELSLYVANGAFGGDMPGGLPASYRDRILPSDVAVPSKPGS